jgi:ankyrin repeat protein
MNEAQAGDNEMVNLLLSRGADFRAVDNYGVTAMEAARIGRHDSTIAILAAAGEKW